MAALFGPFPKDLRARIRLGLTELSPAEARVLRAMMGGGTGEAIAADLGLTASTIGVQVTSILRRCRCTRFELMRGVFELRYDLELDSMLEGKLTLARKLRSAGRLSPQKEQDVAADDDGTSASV